MFGRLVWLVLLVLAAGTVASWLALQPGRMQLEWLGYELEMRTSLGVALLFICLLYTSPSPRDATLSRMPSSA